MTATYDDWRAERARKHPNEPQPCCDHAGLFHGPKGCQLCGCEVGKPTPPQDPYAGLRGFDGQVLEMYRR